MIKSLRKRHLQVWVVLAFLLPAGIVAGTVARGGAGTLQQSTNSCKLPNQQHGKDSVNLQGLHSPTTNR